MQLGRERRACGVFGGQPRTFVERPVRDESAGRAKVFGGQLEHVGPDGAFVGLPVFSDDDDDLSVVDVAGGGVETAGGVVDELGDVVRGAGGAAGDADAAAPRTDGVEAIVPREAGLHRAGVLGEGRLPGFSGVRVLVGVSAAATVVAQVDGAILAHHDAGSAGGAFAGIRRGEIDEERGIVLDGQRVLDPVGSFPLRRHRRSTLGQIDAFIEDSQILLGRPADGPGIVHIAVVEVRVAVGVVAIGLEHVRQSAAAGHLPVRGPCGPVVGMHHFVAAHGGTLSVVEDELTRAVGGDFRIGDADGFAGDEVIARGFEGRQRELAVGREGLVLLGDDVLQRGVVMVVKDVDRAVDLAHADGDRVVRIPPAVAGLNERVFVRELHRHPAAGADLLPRNHESAVGHASLVPTEENVAVHHGHAVAARTDAGGVVIGLGAVGIPEVQAFVGDGAFFEEGDLGLQMPGAAQTEKCEQHLGDAGGRGYAMSHGWLGLGWVAWRRRGLSSAGVARLWPLSAAPVIHQNRIPASEQSNLLVWKVTTPSCSAYLS